MIFGLLNIINFTHGAQYMMGAFVAYFLLQYAGLGYWWALLLAPVAVGAASAWCSSAPCSSGSTRSTTSTGCC